jgi:hypothetical protein
VPGFERRAGPVLSVGNSQLSGRKLRLAAFRRLGGIHPAGEGRGLCSRTSMLSCRRVRIFDPVAFAAGLLD